jgi:transcriptional regulator with XRE-family HTH domain
MVSLVEKTILTHLPMKQTPSKIGLRLRELRYSRHQTQESLAAECLQRGFAITRTKLAKYEIGMTEVPARFIPIITHILKVDITDLLPPIGTKNLPNSRPELKPIRNLSGKRIRFFRKRQKWTQRKLAEVLKKMGVPVTRDIIASVEMQRTRVRDYQLVFFARALQIPLDSLLPDEAGFAKLASTFNGHHRRKIHSHSPG